MLVNLVELEVRSLDFLLLLNLLEHVAKIIILIFVFYAQACGVSPDRITYRMLLEDLILKNDLFRVHFFIRGILFVFYRITIFFTAIVGLFLILSSIILLMLLHAFHDILREA